MPAKALSAAAVGVLNHAVGPRRFLLQPGQQRGAEVETHASIVVEDADDLLLAIENAGSTVYRIALRGDAIVPVVIWGSGVLNFDRLQPGILSWRLIEVAVNAEVAMARRWK